MTIIPPPAPDEISTKPEIPLPPPAPRKSTLPLLEPSVIGLITTGLILIALVVAILVRDETAIAAIVGLLIGQGALPTTLRRAQ